MLVYRSQRQIAVDLAIKTVGEMHLGDPLDPKTITGPLVNKAQFDKVQDLIQTAIDQGATLVVGGPGRPCEFNFGYFVQPTVFIDVTPEMTIAKEEIFGPVLSIMLYDSEEDAVEVANATTYGLSGYVYGRDLDDARRVANKLQAGRIYLNNAAPVHSAPFGGYKRSGNGRQQGGFGISEFLEVKAVIGYKPAA